MEILDIIAGVVIGVDVSVLIALIAANLVLSIVAAIKNGVFTFRHLGDFATTRVLPLIAYLVIATLAEFVEGWTAAAIAIYVGLIAMYGAAILAAVQSLTGIELPALLTRKDD